METNERIKKVDAMYLLGYIFIPIVIALVVSVCGILLIGEAGAILSTICMIAAILWWAVIGGKVYESGRDKKLEELDRSGFTRNHTFNGEGCTVAIDIARGKIALLFRFNPSKVYIRPASALSNVRVDDGKTGSGAFAGSMRVRFCFYVEQTRINVDTFTSNRRWAMNSNYITTGIAKANDVVESLVAAGASIAVLK